MLLLDHKVALVTGGGAGIGKGIALALAEHGATVIIAEIDAGRVEATRAQFAELGPDHLVVQCDVRVSAEVEALIATIDERFHHLDVLVNNVGGSTIIKPFDQTVDEDWDALYNSNLRHVFLVTHRALPLLRATGTGASIISVSTIEAHRAAPTHGVYTAFKHGIVGFTRTLAVELGSEGIRVNAIAPETTDTERIRMTEWIPEEHKDQIPLWIPLGRFGTVKDMGGAAVFLASDLSAWVSGSTIHVDGGVLAQAGWFRTPQGEWTNIPVILEKGQRLQPK